MKKHKPAHSKTLAILLSFSLLAGIVLPSVLSEDKALAVSSNMTVYASQDKYVDATGGYDNWPAGGDKVLYVGNQPSYDYHVEKAVFSFDLSGVPGPITSAVLRVYPYNITGTCNVDVIGSYNDAWTETDSIVPADKNGTPPVTILQNQPTRRGGSIDDSANDFNVTAFVESQRTGDQTATLV